MNQRLHKVNENLKRELSMILAEEAISENGLITITQVFVTPDLRDATVWLSVLNNNEPDKVVELLNKRSHEFFEPLSDRLRMKFVPKLVFRLDDKVDETNRIDALLEDIHES